MAKTGMGFRIFVLVGFVVLLVWNIQAGINNYLNVPKQLTTTHSIAWLKSDYRDTFYVGTGGVYFARGGDNSGASNVILTPREEIYKGARFTEFSVVSYELKYDNLVVSWERKFGSELFMRIITGVLLALVISLDIDALRKGKYSKAFLDHLSN